MGGITIFANVNVINNVIATNVMNDNMNDNNVKRIIATIIATIANAPKIYAEVRIIAKIIARIANAPKLYAEVSPLVAQTKNTVVGSSLKNQETVGPFNIIYENNSVW